MRDYAFDGKISRAVLENYLSRAMTTAAFHPKNVFHADYQWFTDFLKKGSRQG